MWNLEFIVCQLSGFWAWVCCYSSHCNIHLPHPFDHGHTHSFAPCLLPHNIPKCSEIIDWFSAFLVHTQRKRRLVLQFGVLLAKYNTALPAHNLVTIILFLDTALWTITGPALRMFFATFFFLLIFPVSQYFGPSEADNKHPQTCNICKAI